MPSTPVMPLAMSQNQVTYPALLIAGTNSWSVRASSRVVIQKPEHLARRLSVTSAWVACTRPIGSGVFTF